MRKGFDITGVGLTPQNYTKYKRGSLTGIIQFFYSPEDWRPPASWYTEMGAAVPPEAKTPGRPAGAANAASVEKEAKTERLDMRISATTKQKLQWVRDCSQKCKDMSNAEILAYLVDEHVIMQELYFDNLPRFKKQ